MRLLKRFFTGSFVEKRYVHSGALFGDAVSYLYFGECPGFRNLLDKWEKWETEYALRGFRTISLDRFESFGGYSNSLDDVIGNKREPNEEPVFHAKIYRENFLGKINPVINLKKIFSEDIPQVTPYNIPSTEFP